MYVHVCLHSVCWCQCGDRCQVRSSIYSTCPVFLAVPLCYSLTADLIDMLCRNRQGLFQFVLLAGRIMFKRTVQSGQIPENRLGPGARCFVVCRPSRFVACVCVRTSNSEADHSL